MNFRKWIIAKIFFMMAMPVFSQVKYEYVVEQLNNIHGSHWSDLVKRDEDKMIIRNILRKIIENSEFHSSELLSTQVNAIAEFGHFVSSDQNGYLLEEEKSLILSKEELMKTSQSHSPLMEFWKNSGTLDGFDYLRINFQSLPPENRALKYYTLRIMSETLGNDFGYSEKSVLSKKMTDADLYGGMHFRPNLSVKLYERNNKEEWSKRKYILEKLIMQFRQDVSTTNPKLLGPVDQLAMQVSNIPTTKEKDFVVLNNLKDENPLPLIKEKNTKKAERSIASRQDEEELEDESPLRIFFLFIIMLFGFFTGLFFFMRKK
ncbi:MAG: hypothetical protein QE271_12065 [Bacteriovoracaceae bacterium]|nr:hypothetical protein [Bacteriovoracaceae bacterium]